jgi:hypothetical protein
MIFGVPLVHIATGIDPRTGRKRVARGILAIGDVAVGVIALGGAAFGGLTMGGFSLGCISLGGVAIAMWLAVGGCAIGGAAFGGLAVGGVALGGLSLGYYALGGQGFGVHVLAGNRQDLAASEFFAPWAFQWVWWLTGLSIAMPASFAAVYGLIWLVFWKQSRAEQKPKAKTPTKPRRVWLVPILATFNLPMAIGLMFIAASAQEPWVQEIDPFWQVWERIDAGLAFVMAAALFTASVGLYLWQPWARKLMIGVCIYGLAALVISMPYLARVVVPQMAAEFQSAEIEGDHLVAIVAVAIASLVLSLFWLIGQLVYFTRPKVIAAFAPMHGNE